MSRDYCMWTCVRGPLLSVVGPEVTAAAAAAPEYTEKEREQSSLPPAEPPQGKASQCVHAWLTEYGCRLLYCVVNV